MWICLTPSLLDLSTPHLVSSPLAVLLLLDVVLRYASSSRLASGDDPHSNQVDLGLVYQGEVAVLLKYTKNGMPSLLSERQLTAV